jgi:hypothetical protein
MTKRCLGQAAPHPYRAIVLIYNQRAMERPKPAPALRDDKKAKDVSSV